MNKDNCFYCNPEIEIRLDEAPTMFQEHLKEHNKRPEVKHSNPKDAVGSTKVALHVVPPQVLMEVALGLTEGACKYGSYNWRVAGVRASIYYSALMRHIMSWWEGQDIDEDSGLSHVTKALCCLVVIRDAMLQQNFYDDRPPQSINQDWVKDFNELSKKIISKYPDPVPPYTKNSKEVKQ